MIPNVRRATLTAHVMSSVGWFGAVVGLFALSVAGAISSDTSLVRAAYVAMELVGS